MLRENKYNNLIVLTLALAIGLGMVLLYQAGALERVELVTLDYRFMFRNTIPVPSIDYRAVMKATGKVVIATGRDRQAPQQTGIVFIDMPGDSANAAGAWLWPRTRYGTLTKALSYYGARAVVFDALFSDVQGDEDDTSFAEAIRDTGIVYLPLAYDISPERTGYLYEGDGVYGVQRPIPALGRYSRGMGHINAFPDADGRLRRAPASISFRGNSTYQFGLVIGRELLGVQEKDVTFYPERNSISMAMPDGRLEWVPLDNSNQIVINWRPRRMKECPHFSYADVMNSLRSSLHGGSPAMDIGKLKGAVCVVNLPGAVFVDKPKPMNSAYMPAAVTATIIDNVLNKNYVRYPPKIADIVLILIVALIFAKAFTSVRVLRTVMFIIMGVVLVVAISAYGLPKNANMILLFLAVGIIAVFLAGLRFFSGMLLAIMLAGLYLFVSAMAFTLFNLVIVTVYPVVGIFLCYCGLWVYSGVHQYISEGRLFKQATRDPLTTLYNRRHFFLLMDMELKNIAYHKGKSISIIMCDIDNFKKLNDTYGHQAGDAILKRFAHIMQKKCRQSDVLGRYGGEEFIILLSGAGREDAAGAAEKIRLAIEQELFTFRNQPYHTTISMGVVEFSNEKTKEELIEKADQALYKAKERGKNRVCVYGED